MRKPVEIALFTEDVAAVRHFYERLLAGPPGRSAYLRDRTAGCSSSARQSF
jgi:hypothetical protein